MLEVDAHSDSRRPYPRGAALECRPHRDQGAAMRPAPKARPRDAARRRNHMPMPAVGRQGHRRRPQVAGQPRQGRGRRHRRHAARQIPPQGQVLLGASKAASASATSCSAGTCMDVMLRQHDAHRLAQGLSRRARAHRPRHATARCRGTTACRSSSAISSQKRRQGSAAAALPAAGAEARAERARKARRHADVRHGVRVVQLRRDAAIVGRQERRRADADHAGHVRLFAAARERESRDSSRR